MVILHRFDCVTSNNLRYCLVIIEALGYLDFKSLARVQCNGLLQCFFYTCSSVVKHALERYGECYL
jgi:hypothetical protein